MKKKKENKKITNLNINENMIKRNLLYELKRIESNEIIGLFTVTGTLTLIIGGILVSIDQINNANDTNQTIIGTCCGINSLLCYTEALINLRIRNKLDKEEKERIEKEINSLKEKEYIKNEIKKEKIKSQILKKLEEDKTKYKNDKD